MVEGRELGFDDIDGAADGIRLGVEDGSEVGIDDGPLLGANDGSNVHNPHKSGQYS